MFLRIMGYQLYSCVFMGLVGGNVSLCLCHPPAFLQAKFVSELSNENRKPGIYYLKDAQRNVCRFMYSYAYVYVRFPFLSPRAELTFVNLIPIVVCLRFV